MKTQKKINMSTKIKRLARSGAFRRKQKLLIKEIVNRYSLSKTEEAQNDVSIVFEQSEKDEASQQILNIHGEEIQLCDANKVSNEIISFGEPSNIIRVEENISDPSSINCIQDAKCPMEISVLEKNAQNKSRDFPFDKFKFQNTLATWVVNNGIKHDQLRGLLRIWNECVPLPTLPNDPRTLLETPRTIVIKNNNYWHRGLKIALTKMLEKCSNVPDDLSLKINTDGITVLKSSGTEFWPILVEIVELSKIPPGIVGIYSGQGKPKDIESFLRSFVDELNDLISNGLYQSGRKLNIKMKCFIADSPARALLKSMCIL